IGRPCGNEQNFPLPCIAGKTICKNGVPFCQGAVGPSSEACNCKDDDCNSIVDDNALCPPGTTCVNCGCYPHCGGGEFPCQAGFDCLDVKKKMECDSKDRDKNPDCYCVPNATCDPPCPAWEMCKPIAPGAMEGHCEDPCDPVQCAKLPQHMCIKGQCE